MPDANNVLNQIQKALNEAKYNLAKFGANSDEYYASVIATMKHAAILGNTAGIEQ